LLTGTAITGLYQGLPCAFQTAADEFSVIDGIQTGVVVPYGEALKLVDEFKRSHEPKGKCAS
jgi:hypothetical protein